MENTENRLAALLTDDRRASFRKVMQMVLAPAWRLHHYRDARTRMTREMFRELDCRSPMFGCSDE